MAAMPQGSGEATKQRRSSFSFAPLSTLIGEVIGPSENRVAIVLTGHTNGEVQWSPAGTNTGHQSINLGPNSSPLVLTYEQVGDIVKRAWFALLTTGSASQIGIIETFTD